MMPRSYDHRSTTTTTASTPPSPSSSSSFSVLAAVPEPLPLPEPEPEPVVVAPPNNNMNNNVDVGDVVSSSLSSFDSLLAKELNHLSLQERNLVTNEIHGVADRILETPQLLSDSLRKLNELLVIREADGDVNNNNNMDAYWLAHEQNSNYTTNLKFRLLFLRAEKFHIAKAIQRMGRYFQQKLLLFGKEKLSQPITLQDLSINDKDALDSGYIQLLSEYDTSRRGIILLASILRGWTKTIHTIRSLWYIFNVVAMKDEIIQQNGIIILIHMTNFNATAISDQKRRRPMDTDQMGILFESLPIRMEGFHFCCTYRSTLLKLKLAMLAAGTQVRVRSRFHFGSDIELSYALMSFGIPVHVIPIRPEEGGGWDLNPHKKWMEYQRQLEAEEEEDSQQQSQQQPGGRAGASSSSSSTTTIITTTEIEVEPQPQDVLLGKLRKLSSRQIGNDLLAKLIEDYRQEYDQSNRLDKIEISKRIVEIIKSQNTTNGRGGLFLKQTKLKYGKDGRIRNDETTIGWVEVPDIVARDKISHTFRNLRKRSPLVQQQQQQQRPPTSSSTTTCGSGSEGSKSTSTKTTTHESGLPTTTTTTTTINNTGGLLLQMGNETYDGASARAASRLSCDISVSIMGRSGASSSDHPNNNGWGCSSGGSSSCFWK